MSELRVHTPIKLYVDLRHINSCTRAQHKMQPEAETSVHNNQWVLPYSPSMRMCSAWVHCLKIRKYLQMCVRVSVCVCLVRNPSAKDERVWRCACKQSVRSCDCVCVRGERLVFSDWTNTLCSRRAIMGVGFLMRVDHTHSHTAHRTRTHTWTRIRGTVRLPAHGAQVCVNN